MKGAWALALLSCATAAPIPTPTSTQPAFASLQCPTVLPELSEAPAPLGAQIEKVCLVGATEDSYLKLHELVAPREATTLTAAAVRSDLEALFDTGLVGDAVVVAQQTSEKGVLLSYVISEYDTLTDVRFQGVSSLAPEDLRAATHLGRHANPKEIEASAWAVRDLYLEAGFSQVLVRPQLTRVAPGRARLELSVSEGPRTVITAVNFEGTKLVPVAELRRLVTLALGSPFKADEAQSSLLALQSAYYDRGMADTSLDVKHEGGVVTFVVKEGVVFRIEQLSLTGFKLGDERVLLAAFESKPHAVFSRAKAQRDIERLVERARKQGHEVVITPQINLDRRKNTVDLVLEISKKTQ